MPQPKFIINRHRDGTSQTLLPDEVPGHVRPGRIIFRKRDRVPKAPRRPGRGVTRPDAVPNPPRPGGASRPPRVPGRPSGGGNAVPGRPRAPSRPANPNRPGGARGAGLIGGIVSGLQSGKAPARRRPLGRG